MTVPDRTRAARGRAWADTAVRAMGIVEQVAGALLVITILVLVVLQAAQRYLPVDGWVWTGELARYGLVWLSFAVTGHLTSSGGHIGIEVVDYIARGRALSVVKRFADLAIAVAAGAFVIDMWDLVTVPTSQTSPATGLPMELVYIVPLVGFIITAVRAAWAAIAGRPEWPELPGGVEYATPPVAASPAGERSQG